MEQRTVVIPACEEHAGMSAVTLTLPWVCLVCGGTRGEPFKTTSWDGSRQLSGIDGWNNPCGHIEKYSLVREAFTAAASSPQSKRDQDRIASGIQQAVNVCHGTAVSCGWWADRNGEPITRNKGELLMLIVSEVAEAMEGERKDLKDDHLPHRRMAEVELADALIRIFDYAGAFGYDLGGAMAEKLAYNRKRG